MQRTTLLAGIFLVAATSHAGDFCGSLDGPSALRELQRYAAGKGGQVHPGCFEQSFGKPLPEGVQTKILAACRDAVSLPARKRTTLLDPWCRLEVVASGTARAGDRDLVGELMAERRSWDAWPPYEALAASGDDRVRAFVLAQFATHRETWRKQNLRARWAKDAWISHELHVLAALEKIGTPDDVALIGEIEAEQPKHGRIAGAARRAREAVTSRPSGPR